MRTTSTVLAPGAPRPLGTVEGCRPGGCGEPGAAGRPNGKPLLTLPRAHLIVDGYNASIAGYGGLPLSDQRRLLVDGLAAIAARTSAEITCCFDGAEVESRGQRLERGVRVLFSDPGMTADELIRRLVSAEPPGRVLIVVSTDAEVAQRAAAAGANSVPSAALLRLLGTGQRGRRR
jgi:predicted RNA-binding protein with PIN domain